MTAVKLIAVGLYLPDPVLDRARHTVPDITSAELLLRIGLPEFQTFRISPHDFQIINVKNAQRCPYIGKRMYTRIC